MISVEPPCRRILVVEDSPTVAMLCREHLSRAGYDVTVVETGADCLDALEAETPAAMLLDLGLPDMNGIDLLREVPEALKPRRIQIARADQPQIEKDVVDAKAVN